MDKLDIYRCEICGNVVEILINGGGELVCCGQAMKKLESKTQEAAIEEKHVPIFLNKDDTTTEIRVGEVLHPMTDAHHIEFIQVVSPDKKHLNLKFLNTDEEAKFELRDVEKNSHAIEFCNIHGLWEGVKND